MFQKFQILKAKPHTAEPNDQSRLQISRALVTQVAGPSAVKNSGQVNCIMVTLQKCWL